MSWLQITLPTSPEHAPAIEDLLLESGCVAVTFIDAQDNPIFEPDLGTTPLWQQTLVTGLYPGDSPLEATLEQLNLALVALFPDESQRPSIKTEILEDREWSREWMSHYHPMCFGQRLWVCPSWKEAPDPTAVNLKLDPGLAFGTGTHPTTALCLQWLDAHVQSDQTVIDYGCGSGILSIAALLLGAKSVMAVDIDRQALQATQDNLHRNAIDSTRLRTFLPEEFARDFPEYQADLLLANILAGPLVKLESIFASLLKPGGQIVLSGLLENQATEIQQAYAPHFHLEAPVFQEGWIRFHGTRL